MLCQKPWRGRVYVVDKNTISQRFRNLVLIFTQLGRIHTKVRNTYRKQHLGWFGYVWGSRDSKDLGEATNNRHVECA